MAEWCARRRVVAAGAATLLLAAAAKPHMASGAQAESNDAADAQSAAQVKMTDQLRFVPAKLRIHAGDTVVWRNGSVLVHTVTADPAKAADAHDVRLPEGAQPFDSGRLSPDQRFRHTFSVPGHYRYFCKPHEAAGMIGEIVVDADGA